MVQIKFLDLINLHVLYLVRVLYIELFLSHLIKLELNMENVVVDIRVHLSSIVSSEPCTLLPIGLK
jgi:hypothetical protein